MPRFVLFVLATAIGLTACVNDVPMLRKESAQRIAMPVFMIPRILPAEPFTLQAYERVHDKFAPVTLYIEGDGIPYATADQTNFFATPTDPVALRMAAQDDGTNVIYVARPCQYKQKYNDKKECPERYTTTHRYAPEVIDAYSRALDNIKGYYNISEFNLVGYDGGAAIATILAAKREDVLSLRTVAGNLDTKIASNHNNVTLLTGSLNPVDFAPQLTNKPQRHYLGKLDRIMPPVVYSSYAQALGDSPCNAVTLVDNADHENGWTEQWKTLKNLPAACPATQSDELPPVPFDPSSLDGDKGVDHGQK